MASSSRATGKKYRPAIGIVLSNNNGQVLLARRINTQNQWQFPQGGIELNETPREALFRELHEELSVCAEDVEILGRTRSRLAYTYPSKLRLAHAKQGRANFQGQDMTFFLLRFLGKDSSINVLDVVQPEFDAWDWVNFWYPLMKVVDFKLDVYRTALTELRSNLYQEVS